MVEYIKKVEPDHLRVQQREDPQDDEHSKRQQADQEPEKEKDRFGKKTDYKKVLTDEAKGKKRQATLWTRMPTPPQSSLEEGPGIKREDAAQTEEFTVSTTTITFLRATGLIDRDGHPRWPFVGLYGLALIGFIATSIFLLRILL